MSIENRYYASMQIIDKMHRNGDGFSVYKKEAALYFRMAIDKGDDNAMNS